MQLGKKKSKHLSIAHKILHDLPTVPIPSLTKEGCQLEAFFQRTLTRWEKILSGGVVRMGHCIWIGYLTVHRTHQLLDSVYLGLWEKGMETCETLVGFFFFFKERILVLESDLKQIWLTANIF